MDVGKLFQRGTDAQGAINLCLLHGLADGGQLAVQVRKGKVAVRIGEHGMGPEKKPTGAQQVGAQCAPTTGTGVLSEGLGGFF